MNNASNPQYSLTLNAPVDIPIDINEPNNSLQQATDLGTLSGTRHWDQLSIHAADDADWFRFQLPQLGASGNEVAIDFTNQLGNLNISLHDDQGQLLEESTPFGLTNRNPDREEISLAGRPAGNYYLRVFGLSNAVNPLYSLTVVAPAAIAIDAREPNNSLQQATDLGSLSGTNRWDPLTIHSASDADWFRFDLLRSGEAGNLVAIDFNNSLGNLNIALYDATGQMLEEATPYGSTSRNPDSEEISLVGRPAATYFLRVFGLNDATNPSYVLRIDAPAEIPSDAWEPNNTLQQATDLGRLTGTNHWDRLSVHTADDADWFRFETTLTGFLGNQVSIQFDPSLGNLNLSLYNAQGELLKEATPFGQATRYPDREAISLSGRSAGVYYARVFGLNRASHPNYQLTILAPGVIAADWAETNSTRETAKNLGSLSGSYRWDPLTIHAGDDVDWFRFETVTTGNAGNEVSIEFAHRQGDLDLELYDAEGRLLQAAKSARDREAIGFAGRPAGVYYVRAFGVSYAANPSYVLRAVLPGVIPVDSFEVNNRLETATDLGRLLGSQTWDQLTIHTSGDEDWYRFETMLPANVTHGVFVNFDSRLGDVDIALYDAAGRYLFSSTGTSDQEIIPLARFSSGVFYLRVYGDGGDIQPRYTLKVAAPGQFIEPDPLEPNQQREQASPLGSIDQPWSGTFSIHQPDDDDWYQFVLPRSGRGGDEAKLTFAHAECDLGLYLEGSQGEKVLFSNGGTNVERVDLSRLSAGSYVLHVDGPGNCVLPEYRLQIQFDNQQLQPDLFEPNDQFDEATDLRLVDQHIERTEVNIHTPADYDYFVFETITTGRDNDLVRIEFRHDLGDLELQLFDQQRQLVRESTGAIDREEVSLRGLPAGRYYARIQSYGAAVNPSYRLVIQASSPALTPDRFEANNTFEEAGRLRNREQVIAGDVVINTLNLHTSQDIDYFRFTTVATGETPHRLQLISDQNDAGLSLELFDQNQRSISSGRELPFAGLAAGDYFVRVATANDVPVDYSLRLIMPEPTPAIDAWTVMVYMTASNLEAAAFDDINEMEYALASLPQDINLVVYWDQSSAQTTYATGAGSQARWGGVGYGVLVPDLNQRRIATPFLIREEENSGNPQRLSDFMAWTTTVAPAQQYALILWDHGDGLRGSNFDDSDRVRGDYLSVPELMQALSDPRTPHLELLAFDACSMAMIEVADATAPFADYFVASQEWVSGDGYDYTTLFDSFQAGSQVTPESLAKGFVTSFSDSYVQAGNTLDTHSAVRSSQVGGLVDRLGEFVNSVLESSQTDQLQVARAVSSTVEYSGGAPFFDLGGIALAIVRNTGVSVPVRTAATHLLSALQEAVIAKTSDSRSSNGLSLYLPDIVNDGFDYRGEFSSFVQRTRVDQLVQALLTGARVPGLNLGGRGLSARDWAESNDIPAFATALDVSAAHFYTVTDLTLHDPSDEDWFRFTLNRAVEELAGITLISSAASRITISLHRAIDLTLLAQQTGEAGTGAGPISLQGMPAGEYLIRVQGEEAIGSVPYDLFFGIPQADERRRWEGENTRLEKAFSLGTVSANSNFSTLRLDNGEQDWFQFETPRVPNAQFFPLTVETGAPIQVTILDADGAVVSQSMATPTQPARLGYRASGAAERYTLQVTHAADSAAAEYRLRFDTNSILLTNGEAPERSAGAHLATLPLAELVSQVGNVQISDERVRLVGDQLRLGNGEYLRRDEAMQQWIKVQVQDQSTGVWTDLLVPVLIAANPFPFQNQQNHLDVNDDEIVTPLDALLIINTLLRETYPGGVLPEASDATNPVLRYLDVSGDAQVTTNDGLRVINYINQLVSGGANTGSGTSGAGEGEAEAETDPRLPIGWLPFINDVVARSTAYFDGEVETIRKRNIKPSGVEQGDGRLSPWSAWRPAEVDAIWSDRSWTVAVSTLERHDLEQGLLDPKSDWLDEPELDGLTGWKFR